MSVSTGIPIEPFKFDQYQIERNQSSVNLQYIERGSDRLQKRKSVTDLRPLRQVTGWQR